jgi:hypothetical protein
MRLAGLLVLALTTVASAGSGRPPRKESIPAGEGWWCYYLAGDKGGECRRTEELCGESREMKARAGEWDATSCMAALGAACLTAHVRVQSVYLAYCTPTFRICREAQAFFRKAAEDIDDVSDCAAIR